jgi:type II secretory pathway pseudopilin PulG
MRNNKRTQQGTTMIETLIASGIAMTVILMSMAIFLLGATTWYRGQARLDANNYSQRAVRQVSQRLREAMQVSVDANGQGLTYQLDTKDSSGSYTIPLTPDGITHRIELNGTNLVMKENGAIVKTLCTNVTTNDPLSNAAYKIFTPGAGANIRSVVVEVVASQNQYKQETVTSRSREQIYLRNIPSLTQ